MKIDNAGRFQSARAEGQNAAKKFEGEFRDAMLRFQFGGPMWECGQCKVTKRGAAPDPDSPAIECPQCDGVPMQYKYVGPSPHSLRASCVVFYLESGMTETEVMKVSGHNNVKVFRGYARLPETGIKRSMDAAEEMRERRMRDLERVNGKRGRRPVMVA